MVRNIRLFVPVAMGFFIELVHAELKFHRYLCWVETNLIINARIAEKNIVAVLKAQVNTDVVIN